MLRSLLVGSKLLRSSQVSYRWQRWLVDTGARLLIPAPGVAIQPAAACPIPGLWLVPGGAPRDRVLLYIHGGAFTYGSSRTHKALVSRLAKNACIKTLSVDYRLAPQHAFPAALEDCLSAYQWLVGQGYRVAVAGDSAGANLALAITHALKQGDQPLPQAIACLSAVSDLTWIQTWAALADRGSQEGYLVDDPVLVPADIDLVRQYVAGNDPRDPRISPALGDLHGFPPLLIHMGSDELLLTDARQLAAHALEGGVPVELKVWPGMWHVFQAYAPYLPEASRSIKEIGDFIHTVMQYER